MKPFLVILVLFSTLASGCTATHAQETMAQNIPLKNADFEAPVPGMGVIGDPAGCGTYEVNAGIPDWPTVRLVASGGGGVAHWTCNGLDTQVAFLGYGMGMQQDTGFAAKPGVYVLRFSVANWFYSYPGDFTAALYQGTCATPSCTIPVLSPAPFCTQSAWALGDLTRVTVVCPLNPYLIYNGKDALSVGGQVQGTIVVYFANGAPVPAFAGHAGWTIMLKNVSLTFSPQS